MPCRSVGKPLTEQAGRANRTKSTVQVRVEHIFGAQANDMGGTCSSMAAKTVKNRGAL